MWKVIGTNTQGETVLYSVTGGFVTQGTPRTYRYAVDAQRVADQLVKNYPDTVTNVQIKKTGKKI